MRPASAGRCAAVGYLVLTGLLCGYLALILVPGQAGHVAAFGRSIVNTIQIGAAVLCLAHACTREANRAVSLTLGGGLLLWSIGDVLWSLDAAGGTPVTPSLGDAFYLAFYPLAYLGLVLLIRSVGRLGFGMWVDGLLCGLAVASVSAAFAFERITQGLGGKPLAVATNLAYPIGDLVLLTVACGALVMLPHRWHPQWLLLIAGCAAFACSDTVYLVQSAAGSYHLGGLVDAGWPASVLMISAAVWLPSGPRARLRLDGEALLAVPGIAGVTAVVLLVYGDMHHLGAAAVALACATIAVTGLRVVLWVRELRSLMESHRMALTDELTGLGNRRMLNQRLSAMIGDRGRGEQAPRPVAVLLLDIDQFKEINSTFGHLVGDELLRHVAERLRSTVRRSDVLVRLGGDEFALAIEGADIDYASEVAQRLAGALVEPFAVDGMTLHVRASVGIARYPQDAQTTSDVLRCADVAMYRARAGGYTFCVYDRGRDDSRQRFQLHADLREAVEQRELTVYYQPQLDLSSEKIISVEALLRWRRKDGTFVPPDQFIPVAEQTGLMPAITAFVLETALRQCARWRGRGLNLAVAVNVSANDLLDPVLVDRIRGLLSDNQLPPQALILEITEGVLLSDIDRARHAVQRLQDRGITVSIDDFGTGFSSLAYLRDLAVTELKLDRSFISSLGSSSGQRARDLVRSMIDLAHALRLRVVAEGIEDTQTLRMLTDFGCDIAQGYHICRPQPPEELDGSLSRGPAAQPTAQP